MTTTDDLRHGPESAIHPFKNRHLWGPDEVAADDADDETRELVRRTNEERARLRASEQARWAAGRYFIDEAVILIGVQRGLNEFVQQALCNDMLRCAALPDDHKHKLIVRDPSTLIPVQHGLLVSLGIVSKLLLQLCPKPTGLLLAQSQTTRGDRIVPLAMELIWNQVQCGHRGIVHFDARRVFVGVNRCTHAQSLRRGRACNEVDDDLKTLEWPSTPIAGDVAEHSVLDLVPFAGARRQVAHTDFQPGGIGHALQGHLPQPRA